MFKEVLEKHYPWDQEIDVPGRRCGADGAADLCNLFRNPLVHALGVLDTDTNKDGRVLQIVKKPMQAVELYELEMKGACPVRWLDATVMSVDKTVSLRVRSLYWGVREMVERVSHTDEACAFTFPKRTN